MRTAQATFTARLEHPPAAVWDWLNRPGAFERLVPPWERVRVLRHSLPITEGSRMRLRLRVAGIDRDWELEHSEVRPGQGFCAESIGGPLPCWRHCHDFRPAGEGTLMEDRLWYALPLGPLGNRLGAGPAGDRLRRLFDWRYRTLASDLSAHREAAAHLERPLRVAVTGSSGLVGSALVHFLTSGGHQVLRLVRSRDAAAGDSTFWDPISGKIDSARLEGLDAVVHLAGESLAALRWTASKQHRIMLSRDLGTRNLVRALARLEHPPRVLVSASASGYYGSRGEQWLDEGQPPGRGFLAEVCRAWEEAAGGLEQAGARVVRARFAVVLTPAGGLLGHLLPVARLGLAGPLGGGGNYLSWIALPDLVRILYRALWDRELAGPVNCGSPQPVTNREFTATLARVLRRPMFLRAPESLLRLGFGRMADEMFLAGIRMHPRRLEESAFRFEYPELEQALRCLLGKGR